MKRNLTDESVRRDLLPTLFGFCFSVSDSTVGINSNCVLISKCFVRTTQTFTCEDRNYLLNSAVQLRLLKQNHKICFVFHRDEWDGNTCASEH